MKNRSRNEIIATILEIVSSGGATTRTKIMYGAFLSYTQLNEYLAFLLDNDLISRQQQQKTKQSSPLSFIMTEKGTHFLKINNQMNEMIAPIVIQTNQVDRNDIIRKSN